LWLIKRRGRTALGQPLKIELKPEHRGNIAGGLLFGIGWSMAGMCPGPILVNIGEGKIYCAGRACGRAGRRRGARRRLRAAAGGVQLPPVTDVPRRTSG